MDHATQTGEGYSGEAITALIVEDNNSQRSALKDMLLGSRALNGFRTISVFEATNYEKALEHASEQRNIGLVLLDCDFPPYPGGRPERLGKKLCKRLREEHVNCPIIVITGIATNPSDEEEFLQLGANDYMRKPLSYRVLLARIQKRLQEFRDPTKVEYIIGKWTFSPGKRMILLDGRRYDLLTRSESVILHKLCKMRGTFVPREQLLVELNHAPDSSTHTLATHVYRLRQKLETDPRKPRLIVTDKGGLVLNV